jgi:hypothetical protein
MSETSEHLSCQEVVELVSDYLEGELADEATSPFEQHLNFCDGCIWYVDQVRTAVVTTGRLREEEVPPETRERLMKAFRDWKKRS